MQSRDIKSLEPSLIAALAKTVSAAAEETRPSLAAGEYEVDEIVTLRISGSVVVGEDTTKTPTSSIPLLATIALLLRRSGAMREASMNLLREVMTEALEMDGDAREALLAETGVKETETQIRRVVLAALPKTPVKGSVRVKATTVLPTP